DASQSRSMRDEQWLGRSQSPRSPKANSRALPSREETEIRLCRDQLGFSGLRLAQHCRHGFRKFHNRRRTRGCRSLWMGFGVQLVGLDVPCQAQLSQRANAIPVNVKFVPGEAMARRHRMRVMIVVPPFAEAQDRHYEIVGGI